MLLTSPCDDRLRVPRHGYQSALRIGLVFETVIKRDTYALGSVWESNVKVHTVLVQGDHAGRRRTPALTVNLDVHEVGICVIGIHMVYHIAFGLWSKTRALHGLSIRSIYAHSGPALLLSHLVLGTEWWPLKGEGCRIRAGEECIKIRQIHFA